MKKYDFKQYAGNNLLDKVLQFNNIDIHAKQQLVREDLDHELVSPKLDAIVEVLQKIKADGDKIFICGDYDCDGVCATSILVRCFQKAGIEFGYYIPNRIDEGYGANPVRVEQAYHKGYKYLITVDNGVKAFEALQKAQDLGMTVILTDHHSYDPNDIISDYFLHPDMFDEYYNKLCGAALALQISERLIGEDDFNTVLATIATIGDVMTLTDYNRYLVKKGLALLNSKKFVQINKLAKLNKWTSEDIAFQIVPKFNAVGRLNKKFCPNSLVRYLASNDLNFINEASEYINYINDERKQLSNAMFDTSCQLIEDDNFIVVSDSSFHEGLNGIVAGKLCEKFNKPAMVLSANDNLYKGSIRSNGIDLTTFFDELTPELTAYGGHKLASGISFEQDKLPLVKQYCNAQASDIEIDDRQAVLLLDQQELNIDNLETLNTLEPYGEGVERPLMAVDLIVDKGFKIANGKHMKLMCGEIELMKFNISNESVRDFIGQKYRFVGKIKINEFKNKKVINMIIDDVLK